MTTLYGLTNCDSCRRAWRWLQARSIDYEWVDLDRDSLSRSTVEHWLTTAADQTILNRRSTTWRNLDPDQRQSAEADPAKAITEQPRLLKRPVLETDNQLVTGFSSDEFARILGVSAEHE